jgi:16S rRNA (guanine1516-N2)-methyltransferase
MVILAINPEQVALAQKTSIFSLIPTVSEPPSQGYYFCYEDDEWLVKSMEMGPRFKIKLDLKTEYQRLCRQRPNPKKDILSRALGYKGQDNFHVIDGTLGMAKDSLHMLSLGFDVTSYEINPLVFFLVQQCAQKQLMPELGERWKLVGADINRPDRDLPDCDALYLDPMFENIKAKSAPKKQMLFLRAVTESVEPQILLSKALQSSAKRVVVKRPIDGDHLVRKPNSILPGTLIRYDVYLR